MKLPRYPVYVPSKGRYDRCLTARFLAEDHIPFKLVVEPQEQYHYAAQFGKERVLVLPWDNPGSVIPARNWIKQHAIKAGHERHWQIDDNCECIKRVYAGKRIRCNAGIALAAVEDFVERYDNIAVAGLNYGMFIASQALFPGSGVAPYYVNTHVYSCTLTLNSTQHEWRGRYNEDTDYCLQVLADGWCTVLFNAFVIKKIRTLTMKGGNTDTVYAVNDGRLKMAQELARRWPRIVEVKRRWGRPQHVVNWRKFKQPLKRRTDIDWDALEKAGPNEYGMVLKQVKA